MSVTKTGLKQAFVNDPVNLAGTSTKPQTHSVRSVVPTNFHWAMFDSCLLSWCNIRITTAQIWTYWYVPGAPPAKSTHQWTQVGYQPDCSSRTECSLEMYME
eukprot:6456250-Amphidinium_carterae.1